MSVFKDAVEDAKKLKEAAKANASALVVEKYSQEIEEEISRILMEEIGDEDEFLPDSEDNLPKSDQIPDSPETLQKTPEIAAAEEALDNVAKGLKFAETSIDSAKRQLKSVERDESEDDMVEIDLDQISGDEEEQTFDVEGLGDEENRKLEEDIEIGLDEIDEVSEEEMDTTIDSLREELEVDQEPTLSGWLSRPDSEINDEIVAAVMSMMGDNNKEKKEEIQALKKEVESLQEQIRKEKINFKKLKSNYNKKVERVTSLRETVKKAEGHIENLYLDNTRLYFANKVLTDATLNERQKRKLVDRIENTKSAEKIKIIYETIESGLPSTDQEYRSPGEAIRKNRNLTFGNTLRDINPKTSITEATANRWKKLAGITNSDGE